MPLGQRTELLTMVDRWEPSIPARSILGCSPQSDQNIHLKGDKNRLKGDNKSVLESKKEFRSAFGQENLGKSAGELSLFMPICLH